MECIKVRISPIAMTEQAVSRRKCVLAREKDPEDLNVGVSLLRISGRHLAKDISEEAANRWCTARAVSSRELIPRLATVNDTGARDAGYVEYARERSAIHPGRTVQPNGDHTATTCTTQ